MANGAGVFGPYHRRGSWVVIVRPDSGTAGKSHSYKTEAAARAAIEAWSVWVADQRRQSQTRSVEDAIGEYEQHLTDEGYKQLTETIRRCRSFFIDDLESGIASLTPRRCAVVYLAATKRKKLRREGKGRNFRNVKTDKVLSVTTVRGMLTHAKTFLNWCVAQKWLKANPLDGVKPKGKLAHGKPQLRVDEARRWLVKAQEIAGEHVDEQGVKRKGEPGAVAALCALLLAMRASEIVNRQVRDLDDDGRLLWTESKTEAGRRTLEVPELLRPLLQALAAGKDGKVLLFGYRYTRVGGQETRKPHLRGWPLFWTKRIAALAGVPTVSAHSMRGLFSTISISEGAATHLVAKTLGHASDAVTLGSYAAPGAAAGAKQRATLKVLDGGRKGG